MSKKQKIAYLLAVLLFATGFIRYGIPVTSDGLYEVQAVDEKGNSVTPTIAYTQNSDLVAVYRDGDVSDLAYITRSFERDTITIQTSTGKEEKYYLINSIKTAGSGRLTFKGEFWDSLEISNSTNKRHITFNSNDIVTSGTSEITFELSSDADVKITPEKITVPVKKF